MRHRSPSGGSSDPAAQGAAPRVAAAAAAAAGHTRCVRGIGVDRFCAEGARRTRGRPGQPSRRESAANHLARKERARAALGWVPP